GFAQFDLGRVEHALLPVELRLQRDEFENADAVERPAVAGGRGAQLDRQQSVLYPSEVELGETMRLITERIEAEKPDLVVIDSLSELRLLAQDQLRYRRQILALKQFLQGRHCTTLALDDLTSQTGSMELHSLMHGVVSLEQIERSYGA
ncbi:circadian clock protein KaiC, partial [Azospirillum brasilense]|uniref:ATPase domain-containing protein n=1 Tax=Azospirillum brasilense TaxID=192 RepID=UPI0009CF8609